MLHITNYGAACCVIEGNGLRILCDPWFTEGIYLGTWSREHFIANPIKVIGRCDYIWISHVHGDHFDPVFLRSYFAAYPGTKLWLADKNHLLKMARRDGFHPWAGDVLIENGLTCLSLPNHGYPEEPDNIDSALVVTDGDSAVVNMNDCPFDREQITVINRYTMGKTVTALLPYTGAGPWPQCFNMSDSAKRMAADDKKQRYLDQFQRYKTALFATVAVPFSAGYKLWGPLAELNEYRGIPEPEEVQGATLLPVTGASDGPRPAFSCYDWEKLDIRTNAVLENLIEQASERSPRVDGDPLTIDINWGSSAVYVDATREPANKANETIHVDPRLLYGLLTGKLHWNNAEVGSALRFSRYGSYDPRVLNYLYRFHI